MARSLLNLVNNALKYSQDRKYMGVNLYRDNGSVKLEVVDQGIRIRTRSSRRFLRSSIASATRWCITRKAAASAFH